LILRNWGSVRYTKSLLKLVADSAGSAAANCRRFRHYRGQKFLIRSSRK
jgi:hypothetical protein